MNFRENWTWVKSRKYCYIRSKGIGLSVVYYFTEEVINSIFPLEKRTQT